MADPRDLPTTGYAPTSAATAVHWIWVGVSSLSSVQLLLPMYTTGSGLVVPLVSPKLVPVSLIGSLVSAAQATTLRPVMTGAVYRKGVLALPPPTTLTRSWTSPNPGPGGAVHCKVPRPLVSVTTTLEQDWLPIVTVVAPG
jgi:hypothetical protein